MPARCSRSAPTASTRWAREQAAQVFDRDDLRPGDAIAGPAVIRERNATTVIEPGWRATLTARDHLVLERVEAAQRAHAIGTTADPVLLEVFNNLFMAIAEQMGVTLANTAYSVNIKERLDFSCALFDADGNLIANAPHMPVHLGSMGESVKTIIDRRAGTMRRGDVFVLNAPYNGGTHLPDVTVIAPVFSLGCPRAEAAAERIPDSSSPRAAITPTSAASRPARCRPTRRTSTRRACCSTTCSSSREGRFLEAELRAILSSGDVPVAQRRPEPRGPARAGGRVREGCGGTGQDGRRTSACRWCAPTCSTCRTTPRRRCAACSTC